MTEWPLKRIRVGRRFRKAIAKRVREVVRTPVGRPSSKTPENYRHFKGEGRG
jgi:hypothetical protein